LYISTPTPHFFKALENAGIDFWDIGMSMDYKINLGAKNVPRAEFLKHFRQARVKPQVIMPEGVIPNLTPLSKPKK
jgi:Leu/Phe-tRNA-protein transferase